MSLRHTRTIYILFFRHKKRAMNNQKNDTSSCTSPENDHYDYRCFFYCTAAGLRKNRCVCRRIHGSLADTNTPYKKININKEKMKEILGSIKLSDEIKACISGSVVSSPHKISCDWKSRQKDPIKDFDCEFVLKTGETTSFSLQNMSQAFLEEPPNEETHLPTSSYHQSEIGTPSGPLLNNSRPNFMNLLDSSDQTSQDMRLVEATVEIIIIIIAATIFMFYFVVKKYYVTSYYGKIKRPGFKGASRY